MARKKRSQSLAVLVCQSAGVELDHFVHVATDKLTFGLHTQNEKQIEIGSSPVC